MDSGSEKLMMSKDDDSDDSDLYDFSWYDDFSCRPPAGFLFFSCTTAFYLLFT